MPDENKNTYLNDAENAAEMARLIQQDLLITAQMGGLLPERPDFTNISRVLDIACGPGGWVQEVASAYPHIEVIGIDISQIMIEYALAQSQKDGLDNAHFRVMDATQPLDFPDGSFDLVNARTISGFMLTSIWPDLVQEGMRLLRPGGILRFTETDHWGITNSPAFARLIDMSYQALSLTGHSFDPSGRSFGITPMLARLLAQVGLQQIGIRAHAINFSSGAQAHEAMYQNFRVFYKLVQPFLLRTRSAFPQTNIPDQEELDRLYEQVLVQMRSDDFAGIFYLLTAWGEKPR